MFKRRSIDPPVEEVLGMRRANIPNEEIARTLQKRDFGFQEISEAMNQANVKENIDTTDESGAMLRSMVPSTEEAEEQPSMLTPEPLSPEELTAPAPEEAPSPSSVEEFTQPYAPETVTYPQRSFRPPQEQIEELAEAIVAEKWKEFTAQIGDIPLWKEAVNIELTNVKKEVKHLEHRFDSLQQAVLEEVRDYNKSIKSIGSEMKALESVLQKIIEPLTTNIKELSRITQELKGKRK